MSMREDASGIIQSSISSVLPGQNVKKILTETDFGSSRIIVLSIGKAAYTMAKAAEDVDALRAVLLHQIRLRRAGHLNGSEKIQFEKVKNLVGRGL